MSENIFVPLESSPAIKIVPHNQEIIYSTMCKHQYVVKSALVAPSMSAHLSFESHVLMTSEGFVYKVKKTADEYEFVPWDMMSDIRENRLIFHGNHSLTLVRDKEYEDKSSFKRRVKNFRRVIIPYIVKSMKLKLQSIEGIEILTNREIKKLEKKIIKFENLNKKMD